MTDFYPVLARAASRLDVNSNQERNDLYNHARKVLVAQLRLRDPLASTTEIMKEQAALETAIGQLEAELQAAQHRPLTAPASYRPIAGRTPLPGRPMQQTAMNSTVTDHLPLNSEPNIAHSRQTEPLHGLRQASCELSVRPQAASPKEKLSRPGTLDEMLPKSRQSNATAENKPTWSTDRFGSRPEISPGPTRVSGISQTASEKNIQGRVSAARVDALNSHIRLPRNLLTSKGRKSRSASKADTRNNLQHKRPLSLFVIFVCVALIASMMIFLVIIFIPALVTHMPRLVWLSQHLFDNPMPLVVLGGVIGLLLLLALPIFHNRGPKSAIGLLWRSLTRTVPG